MKLLRVILAFCFCACAFAQDQLTEREKKLIEQVERLEARVAVLEERLAPATMPQTSLSSATPSPAPASAAPAAVLAASAPSPNVNPLAGTTVNFTFDGYYEYNFNQPIGRDNLLRAYDVSSNSFSLNQADVVLENAPDVPNNKRWGARLDLQFGQATQTLQGNPSNEPRPEIYRNIFQAYGTYVFPLGSGLTVDFGKWSSSLGIEGNYTKDQMNYSRSFLFNFLPFYHTGVRANYKVNDVLTLNYWMTNGTQQTEAFNNFKDELVGLSLAPRKNVSWNINYYLGQEHPDVVFFNGSATTTPPVGSTLPTLQGVQFQPIPNPPTGHLHIFDSYVTWNASPKVTLALEADYVIERLLNNSSPSHTEGTAGYARYQLAPKVAVAGRAEYLTDRGGLFTGVTQAVKETTFTIEYKLAEGFVMRQEWRRDFSNQAYFLTNTLGTLKKEQDTAAMGLVWWFGPKAGAW